jgi:uncharacterized membrane protein YphA (DoxX/SURF4 family)
MSKLIWVLQILLAALFLFAGGMKLVLPLDQLAGPFPLPGWFLRFIGVVEVLGGLGLVLPGMFKIRRDLTPLAAMGLVVIMAGATVIGVITSQAAAIVIPVVVGALLCFVAYRRKVWFST